MSTNQKKMELDVNGHFHKDWFEVERTDEGIIIMCPDGCRRLLSRKGYVAEYDKSQELWIRLRTNGEGSRVFSKQ